MAAPGTLFNKYGLRWKTSNPVLIELEMIRRRSKDLWKHYREAQKALWPDHDHHRWSDLCLEEIVRNKVTTIMGAGSCGKTHYAAKYALVDYWAHSKETTILVSSTDLRGLELRVWGEIRKLFSEAKERYDFLPGNVLEGKHSIATDSGEDGEGRDLRRGLICIPCLQGGKYVGLSKYCGIKNKRVRLISDECFPSCTLVETSEGLASIASIRPGMRVRTAVGFGRVVAVSKRSTNRIYELTMSDGRVLCCTGNHPLLLDGTWIRACDARQGQFMLGPYETMQILRKDDEQSSFLQHTLFEQVDDLHSGRPGQAEHSRTPSQDGETFTGAHCRRRGSDAVGIVTVEGERDVETHRAPSENEGRKWDWSLQGGGENLGVVQGRNLQLSSQDDEAPGQRIPSLLQSGRCVSENPARNRSGRRNAYGCCSKGEGRKENGLSTGAWVDRVTIYESGHLGRWGSDPTHVAVYNLQVEGHPSYCANGFVVHNCQFMGASFLDSVANLAKNVDFKAVFLGNPVDPVDPLGKAGEPLDGWSALPEPEKTTVWKTRFMGGKCVNLVGTDSPNLDFPPENGPRYPYLIDTKKIEETAAFWGKDSLQYYSQCKGVMKVGLQGRRVITKELCRQHNAFGETLWRDNNRIRIYAADIAFGGVGGDRCVGGWGEVGIDATGAQIFQMHPPIIIPVSVKNDKTPEDQIAEFIQAQLEALDIKPQNCFYDSTGRGSVGASFARVFGHIIPVPIEFGGRPSRRSVRDDLYITDEQNHQRRNKRCDEHYSKFVTELWFSVRYSIESGQFRGMTDDVCEEGCLREWKMTFGNKVEIESKEDTRERMGRSPDLFDWLVTLIEGARQRGFKIKRLGAEHTELGFGRNPLAVLAEKWEKLERSKRLQLSR